VGRVLVVEREGDVAFGLSLMLAVGNHGTRRVSTGVEALSLLTSRRHFDLVITSSNILQGEGIELLRELKKRKPNVPIMMITSDDISPELEDTVGVVIQEPTSMTDLVESVNFQLKKR